MTATGAMPSATASRPGAKATVRYLRMSASKVRVVLDLIRGKQVAEAIEILSFSERLAAQEVLKCLNSAVANAEHNEDIPSEQLYVSACFADQGPSLRRFRPRARGRAGRIHKQTCHLTVEVSRLTDEEMEEMAERQERKSQSASKSSARSKPSGGDRARRVAKSKAAAAAKEADENPADETLSDDDVIDAEIVDTDTDATDTAEAASNETASEDAESEDTTDDSDDTAGDQGEEE